MRGASPRGLATLTVTARAGWSGLPEALEGSRISPVSWASLPTMRKKMMRHMTTSMSGVTLMASKAEGSRWMVRRFTGERRRRAEVGGAGVWGEGRLAGVDRFEVGSGAGGSGVGGEEAGDEFFGEGGAHGDGAGTEAVDDLAVEAKEGEGGDGEEEAQKSVEQGFADAAGKGGGVGVATGGAEFREGEHHAPDSSGEAEEGPEVSDDVEGFDLAEPGTRLFGGGEFGGIADGVLVGARGAEGGGEDAAGEGSIAGDEGFEFFDRAVAHEVGEARCGRGRQDRALADFKEAADNDCACGDGAEEEDDGEGIKGLDEEIGDVVQAAGGGG